MTKIDSAQQGLLSGNSVSFRFISDYNALTATTTRETPTHNIVNDLSWLKGNHTVKVGTNLRWTRIPSTRNGDSWLKRRSTRRGLRASARPTCRAGRAAFPPGARPFPRLPTPSGQATPTRG